MIRRPEPSEYNPRFERYMQLVPETDICQALATQLGETRALLGSLPEPLHEHRYAPEKWTVREVLGHVADTERIFGFRILTFGRGDVTAPLQRAEENLYVSNAGFERYPLDELLEEYSLVRESNLLLLRHLPGDAWDRTGSVSGNPITVRALAYFLVAHERHHLNIIREKYLKTE